MDAEISHQSQLEPITGIAPVEDDQAVFRRLSHQFERCITLGPIASGNDAGYRQSAQRIEQCMDQALGVMAFPRMLESTLGIEVLAQRLRCGQGIFGPINGQHVHALEQVVRDLGPELVSQFRSAAQHGLKHGPIHLAAALADGAAGRDCVLGPETGALSGFEKQSGLDIHAAGLARSGKVQDEGDDFLQGQLTVTRKIGVLFLL